MTNRYEEELGPNMHVLELVSLGNCRLPTSAANRVIRYSRNMGSPKSKQTFPSPRESSGNGDE